MKTTIILLAALLSGCVGHIKVPPGSCTSFKEDDNYGPLLISVSVMDAAKLPNGNFQMGQYDGSVRWLGFGPHTTITGLVVDASGNPVAARAPKLAP